MMSPDASVIREIEEQRPATPNGLLSHAERDRLIARGMVGLYRWYIADSQARRNWSPSHSFDWRALRT
ncbi:MAG TPA: hypothetical protein VHX16_02620, partial [Chloroflexota bacterium]|nr:hypothetical protein [Chloroflexota bacterium]